MTFSSCLRPHYRADDKSRSKEKAKGREYNEAKRKDNSALPNQELMTLGDPLPELLIVTDSSFRPIFAVDGSGKCVYH